MGIITGGVSPQDLIMDGRSVSLYAGGSPPVKVWPTWETVQITLGTGMEARDQFRAALAARGLDYATITEIPFDIELVGTGATQSMFSGCAALTHAPAMDTSQVTSMRSMFYDCSSLTHVPNMDTSQVTTMRTMFSGCESLTQAPAMVTSSVTSMRSMFYECSSLTHVPDMDTSLVTEMYAMLAYCSALTDGNVRLIGKHPSVDTASMIYGSGLTREPWYTAGGAPIDVYSMTLTDVQGTNTAHSLASVTVPAGETWSVRIQGTITKAPRSSTGQPVFRIGASTSGRYENGATVNYSGTITAANSTIAMVTAGTYSLGQASFTGTVTIEQVAKITLGTDFEARDQLRAALSARGLDYRTVTRIPFGIELFGSGSARELFRGCSALTLAPGMDTSGVTSMRSMFYECSSLTSVPDMDTSQVTEMRYMFWECPSLTSVPDMDTSQVTNMREMFQGCSSLVHVPDLATGQVTDMSYMFNKCSSLTSVPAMDTSNVTSMTSMFYNCSSLTTVPAMDTSQVTDMRWMFYGCAALTSIPPMETSRVTVMNSMFSLCHALTSVPTMDTSKVTDMSFMFNRCYALTTVPAMDTSRATNMSTMFQFCSTLVSVPDMVTSQVTDAGWMFYGCSSLTDGNVRLIGRNSQVVITNIITASGLTRIPFYDTAGNPI